MIEIKNLTKGYTLNEPVISDLTLTIKKGTILGLVGVNGSGKSTLLRTITGVFEPDEGCVLIEGCDIHEDMEIRKKMFFLPDDPFYSFSTTTEKLKKFYSSYYDFDEGLYGKYVNTFNIDTTKRINNFSKGMRRQLYLALAISCKPEYLFLDEVFDGLDANSRLELNRALINMNLENNCTIVLTSHSLRELEGIVSEFALLDDKGIKLSGEIDSEIDKYNKYQMSFEKDFKKEDFVNFELLKYNKQGKIYELIIKGDFNEVIEKIDHLKPIFVEVIPISFEELFLINTDKEGLI